MTTGPSFAARNTENSQTCLVAAGAAERPAYRRRPRYVARNGGDIGSVAPPLLHCAPSSFLEKRGWRPPRRRQSPRRSCHFDPGMTRIAFAARRAAVKAAAIEAEMAGPRNFKNNGRAAVQFSSELKPDGASSFRAAGERFLTRWPSSFRA